MKKFTDYNFDFENSNKNKTPEFKEFSKYNLNYQLNNEQYSNINNNCVNNKPLSSVYEYNCNYTLHSDDTDNKDNIIHKGHESFSNKIYEEKKTNQTQNNNFNSSVNYSKLSNNSKLDSSDINKHLDMVNT